MVAYSASSIDLTHGLAPTLVLQMPPQNIQPENKPKDDDPMADAIKNFRRLQANRIQNKVAKQTELEIDKMNLELEKDVRKLEEEQTRGVSLGVSLPEDEEIETEDPEERGALAKIYEIKDEGERERALEKYYSYKAMGKMDPTMMMFFQWMKMQQQNAQSDGDATPPAQPKSLVDVTNELVQVKENMIKLGMVKDPNAPATVTTTPIEDPIVTKIKGAIVKRIEVVADEIVNPRPAVTPTKEEPLIPAKIGNDGSIQVETGGISVKLPPDKFIDLQRLNSDFAIRKMEAQAKLNESKSITDAVSAFLMPAGEAVAETVKGSVSEEEDEAKKPFIDVACIYCMEKNVKTMLRIVDYEHDGDFECKMAKDVHPDKPVLHWKPSTVPIQR